MGCAAAIIVTNVRNNELQDYILTLIPNSDDSVILNTKNVRLVA